MYAVFTKTKRLPDYTKTISLVARDSRSGQWLCFDRPHSLLVAHELSEIMPLLEEIEEQTQKRAMWAAGYISYEAAPAFDRALVVTPGGRLPLAWFGLYAQPRIVTPVKQDSLAVEPLDWKASLNPAGYESAIARIKDYIQAGDTYQVNFTFRLNAPFQQEPWSFFQRIVAAQASACGFFLDTPEWSVCSASPELFFELRGRRLHCRPMKGTMPRGRWSEEDEAMANQLRHSEKNRAENLMIVDMMRNDLGRIAEIGSVQVDSLFDIERYPTLWQMTSSIHCATQAGLPEIFRALFPAASITGAPKARTMQIIAELETAPRSVYTGTAGFIGPDRNAHFNVAIRTVQIDKRRSIAEYGVGGGIVWDSSASSEWEECQVKARLLTHALPGFSLLETMLWSPSEGFFLLDAHLGRINQSAIYFGFALDTGEMRKLLFHSVQNLPPVPHRARLIAAKDSQPRVEVHPCGPRPDHYSVGLATKPVDSSNPLLYHKTTCREVYTQRLAATPQFDDLILWNERGEITESCIANILVEMDGEWFTPPVHCGLLPGVYRSHLLAGGHIKERVIRLNELRNASSLKLINSVRKEWKVTLPSEAPEVT